MTPSFCPLSRFARVAAACRCRSSSWHPPHSPSRYHGPRRAGSAGADERVDRRADQEGLAERRADPGEQLWRREQGPPGSAASSSDGSSPPARGS